MLDMALTQTMRQQAFTVAAELGRARTVTVRQVIPNGENELGEPEWIERTGDPIRIRIRKFSEAELHASQGLIRRNDLHAIAQAAIELRAILEIDDLRYEVIDWEKKTYGDYTEWALQLRMKNE